MNRLRSELHRLFSSLPSKADEANSQPVGLATPHQQVRALVLEVCRPADWQALSKVWKGVQIDLALPAPAIVVNGVDGYQLWFSFTEPVPMTQALAFLGHLRERYLGDMAPERVRTLLAPDESGISPEAGRMDHAGLVPAQQKETENWSAFVSADLASIFADDPWLDRSPGADAQADLLCRIQSTSLAEFHLAFNQVKPAQVRKTPSSMNPLLKPVADCSAPLGSGGQPLGDELSPQRFLLQVMNDSSVELHLRIDAAKALLPYSA